jgi:hypothetical protein
MSQVWDKLKVFWAEHRDIAFVIAGFVTKLWDDVLFQQYTPCYIRFIQLSWEDFCSILKSLHIFRQFQDSSPSTNWAVTKSIDSYCFWEDSTRHWVQILEHNVYF